MKKRFTEARSWGFARGRRRHPSQGPLPEARFSLGLWRSKFGGISVSGAKRLKELEIENTRLKKLLADSWLENEVTREALRRKC
jgi:putative transposase